MNTSVRPPVIVDSAARRATDILLTLIAAIPALPLVLLAAIAIRLTSPGTALYRSHRAGRTGVPFVLLKLRTMHTRLPESPGAPLTTRDDPRIFPVGRWLRSTKVDELPQLWNVLRGDMTLIGPRPEALELVEAHYDQDNRRTLAVRPGLASPGALFETTLAAHLNVGDPTTYAQLVLPAKLHIDDLYLQRRNFGDDWSVVWRTLGTIAARLTGRTATDAHLNTALASLPPSLSNAIRLALGSARTS